MKSRPNLSHLWFLPAVKLKARPLDLEQTVRGELLKLVMMQRHLQTGDMETKTAIVGDTLLRNVRDTTSSLERRRRLYKQMEEKRRLQYQRFLRLRRSKMNDTLKKPLPAAHSVASSAYLQTSGTRVNHHSHSSNPNHDIQNRFTEQQRRSEASSTKFRAHSQSPSGRTVKNSDNKNKVYRGSAKSKTARNQRLERFRLLRQRYWEKKAKLQSREGRLSHGQDSETTTKAGVLSKPGTESRQSQILTNQTDDQRENQRHEKAEQDSSHSKDVVVPLRENHKTHSHPQQHRLHQSTPNPLGTRLISEMSTLYPFMETTEALNYLTSYSLRPRPRRWPLKMILEDTTAPTRSVNQDIKEHEKTNDGLLSTTVHGYLSTAPRTYDSSDNDRPASESPHVTAETAHESTSYELTKRPQENSSVKPNLIGATFEKTRVSPAPTGATHHNSNSRPKVVSGRGRSSIAVHYVGKTHKADSISRSASGQSFGAQRSKQSPNVSLDGDIAGKDKIAVSHVVGATSSNDFLTTNEGSGDDEGAVLSDRDKLTITKSTRKQRRQRLRAARRQRKARERRRGKKGRKKKNHRNSKSRAERRAARKRRRRLQRLRRKMLRQKQKEQATKAHESEQHTTSVLNKSKNSSDKEQTPSPRPTQSTFESSELNASPYGTMITEAANIANTGSKMLSSKEYTSESAVTESSEIVKDPTLANTSQGPRQQEHVDSSTTTEGASLIAGAQASDASISPSSTEGRSREYETFVTAHPDDRVSPTSNRSEMTPSNISANVSSMPKLLSSPEQLLSLVTSNTRSTATLATATTVASSHTAQLATDSYNHKTRGPSGMQTYNSTFVWSTESFFSDMTTSIAQQLHAGNRGRLDQEYGMGQGKKSYRSDFTPTVGATVERHNSANAETHVGADQSVTKSPFIGHKTAYDFLSSQKVVRRNYHSEAHRERNELHRRMSERLCKVFNKSFVSTGIGGKCV